MINRMHVAKVSKTDSTAIFSFNLQPTALSARGGNDFLRGVSEVAGGRDRKTALREERAALLSVRAFDAHDDRNGYANILHGMDDAFGDHVAANDAAEDVHENRAH